MNTYKLKREILRRSGVTAYRWRHLRPGLYVFNYHRVGDEDATPFDPNVFSCDEAHFDEQLATIKSRFRLVTIADLTEMLESGRSPRVPLALITFDDGYRDNYTNAFPILKALQISGVFFVPTSFIGSEAVPWWDEIAWMVKNTQRENIIWSGSQSIRVNPQNIKSAIRETLQAFKRDATPVDVKLQRLRSAMDCRMPIDAALSLFMNWNEIREMRAAGMEVGSHSLSHSILAHLSEQEQLQELSKSKEIIERELGETISSVAYPVGGSTTYTTMTEQLAAQCGYQMAFSFNSGFNREIGSCRFDLRRLAVEGNVGAEYVRFISVFAGIDLSVSKRMRRVIQLLRNSWTH